MNTGSMETQLEPAELDEATQYSVDPNVLWERYESNPECYDGVALAIQRSWTGIIVAGAVVGMFVFVFMVVDTAVRLYVSPIQWAFSIPMAAAIFVIAGLIVAFWSVFAILVVMTLNFSFWEMFDRRTAVAICAGGSGFLAVYWPLFYYASMPLDRIPFYGGLVVIAMTVCQFGALWWGSRELAFIVPERKPSEGPAVPIGFQFKITHIMIAMVWFGVLFALDQITARHEVLVMAAVYVVIQSMLLVADWLMFRRRGKKRLVSAT